MRICLLPTEWHGGTLSAFASSQQSTPISRKSANQTKARVLDVLASAVAAQMFDNARLVAGVLPDSRTMLPRLNQMLEGILSDEDDADELDDLD